MGKLFPPWEFPAVLFSATRQVLWTLWLPCAPPDFLWALFQKNETELVYAQCGLYGWPVRSMFIFFKKMVFKIKGYHLIREMRFDRWEISTTVAIICSLSPLSSSVSYCLHLVREFKMITFIWYLLTWEQKAEERQEEGNTQKDSMIKSLGRVFPYLIFPLKLTRTCFNSEEGCIPTVMVWFKVEPLHEAMSQ